MPGLSEDISYSHSVLNFLNAEYQGRFAYYNILAQLEPELDLSTDIDQSRQALTFAAEAFKKLWKNEPIFSLSWKKPETPDAEACFELLDAAFRELATLALEIRPLLQRKDFHNHSFTDLSTLVASYGRFAYGRDNFCRGLIELAKHQENHDLVENYERHLKESDDDIKVAHAFLRSARERISDPSFFTALFSECVTLPGEFRCRAHDIRQVLSVYLGEFTYEFAGISDEERASWKDLGINPVEAGYWLSFSIGAREALSWIQKGVTSFRTAGLWRSWFFPPDIAAAWIKVGFTPPEATPWANSEIAPEKAKEYREKGVLHPSGIPTDG